MSVQAILRSKGTAVCTVRPDVTVAAAIDRLQAENIGALVVGDGDQDISGIVSERDIVRGLAERGASVLDLPVREIMTSPVRTCRPEDEIGDLMAMMTSYRIRHLPVEVDGRLAGIVSIGDVVKKRLEELEFERDVMRDMVAGR